jgi:excinuclease ABC subunit B
MEKTGGEFVEQVIRPTGLLDPVLEVVPARGQVAHLLAEIHERIAVGERVIVTTLTKRLAEDLSDYFCKQSLKCQWLHSELDAFERVELLKNVREGACDVLVGVNLLREGIDLPEVSLVAIMDADKQGFLRSETSLIQTIGRAARNVNAKVILYADKITDAMRGAIDETLRRRQVQLEYNQTHGITPVTIKKNLQSGIEAEKEARRAANEAVRGTDETVLITQEYIQELENEMLAASEELDFERAAVIRDRISQLQDSVGKSISKQDFSGGAGERDRGKRGKKSGGRVPKPKSRN